MAAHVRAAPAGQILSGQSHSYIFDGIIETTPKKGSAKSRNGICRRQFVLDLPRIAPPSRSGNDPRLTSVEGEAGRLEIEALCPGELQTYGFSHACKTNGRPTVSVGRNIFRQLPVPTISLEGSQHER